MEKRTRALQILLAKQSVKKSDALAEKNTQSDKLDRLQRDQNTIVGNLQKAYLKLNENCGGANIIDVASIEQYHEYIHERYSDYQYAEQKCKLQEGHFNELEQVFFKESNKEKMLKNKLEESVHIDRSKLQNRVMKSEEDTFSTYKLSEVLQK